MLLSRFDIVYRRPQESARKCSRSVQMSFTSLDNNELAALADNVSVMRAKESLARFISPTELLH